MGLKLQSINNAGSGARVSIWLAGASQVDAHNDDLVGETDVIQVDNGCSVDITNLANALEASVSGTPDGANIQPVDPASLTPDQWRDPLGNYYASFILITTDGGTTIRA
ncbi:MAG: hypothetical protein HY300_06085 [Verrucomicrobia bacterium]|nr:hypothetical protein [Verrucomicrobiota bacterium]